MTKRLDGNVLSNVLRGLSPDSEQHADLYRFTDAEWGMFLYWADVHRLLPVLNSTLNASSLPESVSTRLKAAAAEATAHNLALKGLARRVTKSFEENGIDCLQFKGPGLAEHLYGSASSRACYDIDIVIRPEDHRRASKVLSAIDISRDAPDTDAEGWHNYRYEESYTDLKNQLFLELHWRFMPAFIPFDLTAERVFEMTDPDRYTAGSSYLSNHTLLILLAAHGYRHYWRQLCWLTDIIRLIELGIDWSALAETASAFKVERIVGLSLKLASQIRGVNVPDCPLSPLPESGDHYIDSIRESWGTLEDNGGPTDYRYIRTFLDTFYQRQVCLKRLTFQPTLADFDYVNLPPALRWLYPGVRLTRLVARKKETR